MPIAGSSYRFNFCQEEKKTIDELRVWSKTYFEENYIYEIENEVPIHL
jgi:hypothetical protein